MNVDLVKTFSFEAAHTTSKGRGAQNEPHGHSYKLELVVSGEVDAHSGWLVDYGELTENFQPFFKEIDHHLLNDLPGLDDVSLQGLRAWALARLDPYVPHIKDVRISIVGPREFLLTPIPEIPSSEQASTLRFNFESAHFLPNVPSGHKCKRMHGHSFTVDVSAANPNQSRQYLQEIYDALDRRCLNVIEGLENPTSENVCRWIWDRLAPDLGELKKVAVAETCTARCEYYGQ